MSKCAAKSSPRLALVISDIHAGSTYALMPPGFETHEGNAIAQNAIQKWLWECWTHSCNKWLPSITGEDPFILIVNGDATEDARHHHTTEVISPDNIDHLNAAQQILEPLAKRAAKIILTEGTLCHTHNMESSLAKMLGAVPDPDTKRGSWGRLKLTIAGTRCVFFHHISTSQRQWLTASALSIFLANEQVEAAKNGEPIPMVLGCAHRHVYGEFRDATGLAFVTPPWQCGTRFARRVVPSARTRPGMVLLDWRNRKDGTAPESHTITFRPQESTGLTL